MCMHISFVSIFTRAVAIPPRWALVSLSLQPPPPSFPRFPLPSPFSSRGLSVNTHTSPLRVDFLVASPGRPLARSQVPLARWLMFERRVMEWRPFIAPFPLRQLKLPMNDYWIRQVERNDRGGARMAIQPPLAKDEAVGFAPDELPRGKRSLNGLYCREDN